MHEHAMSIEMASITKNIEKNNDSKYDFTVKVPKTFNLIIHSPFSTGFFIHENREFKKFDERIKYNILKDLVTRQNFNKKTNFFSIETDDKDNDKDDKDKFAGEGNNAIKFALKLDNIFKEISYVKIEELLEWTHIRNSISITQFGIGIISMEIKVTINKIDIDIIKRLDKRIKQEIKKILENISRIIACNNKEHSNENKRNPKGFHETLGLTTFNVCNYLWHHTIYWFADNTLLKGMDHQSSSFGKFFNTLLDQDINEKRYLLDRCIFFGWTKSLIITIMIKENAKTGSTKG